MALTLGVLLVFIAVGLIPQIPTPAKFVIQLVLGAIIYVGFSETIFPLPVSEDATLPELFGGNGGVGGFSVLCMGTVATVIGFVFSLIGIPIRAKVVGRDD